MTADFLASKETGEHQKARTGAVQILFVVAVLPAAVIAGWRWFL